MTAPFHHVGFADFWLADQLNSLVVAILDMEYMSCFYALDYYSVQGELTVIAISFSFAFSVVGFFRIYRGFRNLYNFVFPRVAVGFARIYRNYHYRCNFVLLRAVVGFVGICRRQHYWCKLVFFRLASGSFRVCRTSYAANDCQKRKSEFCILMKTSTGWSQKKS